MTHQQALAVLHDPQAVAAYGEFFRDPMGTSPQTYELACDWLQAALAVAACEPERSEGEL